MSIQSQVLNLLVELKQEFGLTYLFVAHDLAVVGYISDRIAVMYLGKVVELATGGRPLRAAAAPVHGGAALGDPGRRSPARKRHADHPQRRRAEPDQSPVGCRFRTRCPLAQEICAEVEPPLDRSRPGHLAACHFAGTPIAATAAAAGQSTPGSAG